MLVSHIIILPKLCRLILGQHLFGIYRRDDRVSQLTLQLLAGYLCYTAAAFGYALALIQSARLLLLGYFGSRGLGQRIQRQLDIGHVVAQTLFLQTLELLVALGVSPDHSCVMISVSVAYC